MDVLERWTIYRRADGVLSVWPPPLVDGVSRDGWEAVEVVPATQLEGAVSLTDEERERVLWWLRQPVPPGPMKELDERILQKFAHPSRGR
jgi:hypothetical protein